MAATTHRSVWRHAAGTLGANAALALLGLATGTLSARLLGPHGRGELAAIQTIPTLLAGIALIGMPSALTYLSAKNPTQARPLYASAVAVALPIAVLFVCLGFIGLPYFLQTQDASVIAAARVYLVFAPLQVFQALPYAALLGLGRTTAWNALRLLPPIVWISVLGIGFATSALSPAYLSRLYLVGYACTIPLVTWTLFQSSSGRFAGWFAHSRGLVRFGAPGAFSALPSLLNLRLDQVLLIQTVPANHLGYYVAAVAWGSLSSPLLTAMAPIVMPAVAREGVSRDRDARAAKSSRIAFAAATGAALLLAATAPLGFIVLFGESYRPGLISAIVLSFAGGIAGLNAFLEEVHRGLGAPRWPLVGQLSSLPITLALLYLLLPRLGILGAALSSLAAYAFTAGVLLVALQRALHVSLSELTRTRVDDLRAPLDLLAATVRRQRT